MARHTITVKLNSKSIGSAIKELRAYKAWVERKTAELTESLAKLGAG